MSGRVLFFSLFFSNYFTKHFICLSFFIEFTHEPLNLSFFSFRIRDEQFYFSLFCFFSNSTTNSFIIRSFLLEYVQKLFLFFFSNSSRTVLRFSLLFSNSVTNSFVSVFSFRIPSRTVLFLYLHRTYLYEESRFWFSLLHPLVVNFFVYVFDVLLLFSDCYQFLFKFNSIFFSFLSPFTLTSASFNYPPLFCPNLYLIIPSL